jgi:hypothetical protein
MADGKARRFTFDPDKEGGKVPTLTELLYSKNVVKSGGSPGQGRHSGGQQNQSEIMTLEPTITTTEHSFSNAAEEVPILVQSEIGSNPVQPPSMGSANTLAGMRRVMAAAIRFSMPPVTHPIPHGRAPASITAIAGIRVLFEKAKVQASLVFEAEGDTYKLKSKLSEVADRGILWNGIEISKTEFADLIGRLKKFGFAEFSTLGVTGQGNFDRTAFRTAVQAKTTEWVTFVPVTEGGKDVIVLFLSEGSIQTHLPAFHSANSPMRAAA